MVTRNRVDFIFTGVLQVLREAKSAMTAEDIVRRVDSRREPWWRGDIVDPTGQVRMVRRYLIDLQRVGFAVPQSGHGGEQVTQETRWKLDPNWIGKSDGDGGIEPPPPPDQNPFGGDDGDDFGGIGEVLAHPFLFSLSADDLDAAIDRAIGKPS